MPKSEYPTSEMVRRYRIGERIARIAADAGMSRIGVWKRLVKAGEPMTRVAPPVEVTCQQCGAVSRRARHKSYRHNMFCGEGCYRAWLKGQKAVKPDVEVKVKRTRLEPVAGSVWRKRFRMKGETVEVVKECP